MRVQCSICATRQRVDGGACNRCGFGQRYVTFEQARAEAFDLTVAAVTAADRNRMQECCVCHGPFEGDPRALTCSDACADNRRRQVERMRIKRHARALRELEVPPVFRRQRRSTYRHQRQPLRSTSSTSATGRRSTVGITVPVSPNENTNQ